MYSFGLFDVLFTYYLNESVSKFTNLKISRKMVVLNVLEYFLKCIECRITSLNPMLVLKYSVNEINSSF